MREPTVQDIAMHKKWIDEGGKEKLVAFDFLTPDSIVWEIGGWRGGWVQQIAEKYNSHVYVFEPIHCWWLLMSKMFAGNSKIKLFNYGLGNKDRFEDIGVEEDASGMFCDSKIKHMIQIKSIGKVMFEMGAIPIDVMQCNCEGGEYEIFPQLIESSLIQMFNTIIIQFHNYYPTDAEKRRKIQEGLSKTHKQTICYDWKFEYWERQ